MLTADPSRRVQVIWPKWLGPRLFSLLYPSFPFPSSLWTHVHSRVCVKATEPNTQYRIICNNPHTVSHRQTHYAPRTHTHTYTSINLHPHWQAEQYAHTPTHSQMQEHPDTQTHILLASKLCTDEQPAGLRENCGIHSWTAPRHCKHSGTIKHLNFGQPLRKRTLVTLWMADLLLVYPNLFNTRWQFSLYLIWWRVWMVLHENMFPISPCSVLVSCVNKTNTPPCVIIVTVVISELNPNLD